MGRCKTKYIYKDTVSDGKVQDKVYIKILCQMGKCKTKYIYIYKDTVSDGKVQDKVYI